MIRNKTLSCALSGLLASSAFCGPAAPPSAAAAEEVAALVRDLGCDAVGQRNAAAARLLEIGEPAQEALIAASRGDNLEAAAQAARILKAFGYVPPETQKRISRLTSAMKEARDPEEGLKAWRELQSLGWMAAEAIREMFPIQDYEEFLKAPLTRACCSITFMTPALSGSDVNSAFSIRVTNSGPEPLWITPYKFRMQIKGGVRYMNPHLVPTDQKMGVRLDENFHVRHLKPGESLELSFHGAGWFQDTTPGSTVEVVVEYDTLPRQEEVDLAQDDAELAGVAGLPRPLAMVPTLGVKASCTARVLVKP